MFQLGTMTNLFTDYN